MKHIYLGLKTSFCLFSISLFVLLLLTSCSSCSNAPIPPTPPEKNTSDQTPGPISENLVARIYFDATLSMQGFVIPGSTHYKQMCRELKSVITVGGWSNEKVKYFKFGTKVEPISDEDYQTVAMPEFYETEDIMGQTFIDKVLNYKMPGPPTGNIDLVTPTLVIIVTDLFQDKGDINSLVAQLKEKYVEKGIEVGLLGFRSQFKGKIYDIGFGERSRLYESTEKKSETYRPFYLLVLGKYADIANYFDNLIARGFDEAETIIFSRYIVSPLLSFEGALIEDPINNLNPDSFVPQEPRLTQYEIVDNSKSASFSAKMKYNLSPHAMFFDSNTSFEVSIIAWDAPMGENKESSDAQKCLKVTSTSYKNDDGNGLSVTFSLDARTLPGKAVYLYEVTLRPGIEKYRVPDWCSDWNMGTERHGSKTLNLVNFVRDLSQVTAHIHRPSIAKFYCYIEKR